MMYYHKAGLNKGEDDSKLNSRIKPYAMYYWIHFYKAETKKVGALTVLRVS